MDLATAWDRLGIVPTDDAAAVRAAYLSQLHRVHPDHSAYPDANTVTAALTDAYDEVRAHLGSHGGEEPPLAPAPGMFDDLVEVVPIALVADDTVAVALPAGETYALLVEAGHRMGEVVHIEPSSGILQVVVEFVEAPACHLLLVLQGRATGVTEVFCTVESLEPAPPPPTSAVAAVLLDELIAVSRESR